jgi:hypothetical protein
VNGRLGNILLDKSFELSPFSGNFIAFELGNSQDLGEFRIKFGQFEDIYDLFTNPFVVGDGISTVREEKELQKLLEGVVQTVEGLEIKAAFDIERDIAQIAKTELFHFGKSLLA